MQPCALLECRLPDITRYRMAFGEEMRAGWSAIVASGAWFASLPADLQAFLLQNAQYKSLANGQRLFGRGDAPDGIYCLVGGAVRIAGLTPAGQEALLVVLEPPQWFGEIALFDQEPRTHDAWAETDCTLAHVPQQALQSLLVEHPQFWQHLGRLLTQKLRSVFIGLEDTALLPPTPRVVRRLAIMATGYGTFKDRSKRVLKVSQQQLGQMLSLSRQTVNQALGELEAAGAIRRNRGAIEIIDWLKLGG